MSLNLKLRTTMTLGWLCLPLISGVTNAQISQPLILMAPSKPGDSDSTIRGYAEEIALQAVPTTVVQYRLGNGNIGSITPIADGMLGEMVCRKLIMIDTAVNDPIAGLQPTSTQYIACHPEGGDWGMLANEAAVGVTWKH